MLKADKSSENFVFNSNFLCDGAINRPPQPGFLRSSLNLLSMIHEFFQKNQSCGRETRIC